MAAERAQILQAAASHLRARRFRVVVEDDSVRAEKGYLREAGNLLFHICLVTTLIGLAWGSLFSFRGTAVVVEGQAFSNTLTQYDEFGAGAAFSSSHLSPFTVRVDRFDVRFEERKRLSNHVRLKEREPATPCADPDSSHRVGKSSVCFLCSQASGDP